MRVTGSLGVPRLPFWAPMPASASPGRAKPGISNPVIAVLFKAHLSRFVRSSQQMLVVIPCIRLIRGTVHGGQISSDGVGRAKRSPQGNSGRCRASGGRPGAGHSVDAVRLDQRADRRSFRGTPGYGAAVAQRLHERRDRRAEGERCAWPCSVQGRGGDEGRRAAAFGASGGSTKLDLGAPCRGDHTTRGGHHLSIAALQDAAQKRGFGWRRPRHTLKGRQDPDAVERVGLRLKLRKGQAEAGDIVLLFSDESEALTHPYLAHAWAKRGADLRVPAPGQSKKVAMMGPLD